MRAGQGDSVDVPSSSPNTPAAPSLVRTTRAARPRDATADGERLEHRHPWGGGSPIADDRSEAMLAREAGRSSTPRTFGTPQRDRRRTRQRPQQVVWYAVTETLKLTIVFEYDDDWVVASVPEVPGAHSQGRTRAEARENVIDALRGILELRFGEHALDAPADDSESLEVQLLSAA